MVTIDLLISHLENLREYHGTGDVQVTVPILDPDDDEIIAFVPLEKLNQVNILEVEVDGKTQTSLYIDVCQFLVEEEETGEPQ